MIIITLQMYRYSGSCNKTKRNNKNKLNKLNNFNKFSSVLADDISSLANSITNLTKLFDNGSCKYIYHCKSKNCKLKS